MNWIKCSKQDSLYYLFNKWAFSRLFSAELNKFNLWHKRASKSFNPGPLVLVVLSCAGGNDWLVGLSLADIIADLTIKNPIQFDVWYNTRFHSSPFWNYVPIQDCSNVLLWWVSDGKLWYLSWFAMFPILLQLVTWSHGQLKTRYLCIGGGRGSFMA